MVFLITYNNNNNLNFLHFFAKNIQEKNEFHTLISSLATFKANSMTHPVAILAALAVCRSFQVVSESTPMPPHWSLTKFFIGSSATEKFNFLLSQK